MFSCDEEPLSPEKQAAQDLADDPRPKLLMTMSDDLELTISIINFEKAVSILSFELIFDPQDININTVSGSEFGEIDFQSLEVSDTTLTSFSFFGKSITNCFNDSLERDPLDSTHFSSTFNRGN